MMYGILSIPVSFVIYITICAILYISQYMLVIAVLTSIAYIFVKEKSIPKYISCVISTCVTIAMPIAGIAFAMIEDDYLDIDRIGENSFLLKNFLDLLPVTYVLYLCIIFGLLLGISTFWTDYLEDKVFAVIEFLKENHIFRKFQ